MKTKYPIIGVIIALILLIALESTYFPMQDTIMGILLVLLLYRSNSLLSHQIHYHKRQHQEPNKSEAAKHRPGLGRNRIHA